MACFSCAQAAAGLRLLPCSHSIRSLSHRNCPSNLQRGKARCVRQKDTLNPCAVTLCAIGNQCVVEVRERQHRTAIERQRGASTVKQHPSGVQCHGSGPLPPSPRLLPRLCCCPAHPQGGKAQCISVCASVRCKDGLECQPDEVRGTTLFVLHLDLLCCHPGVHPVYLKGEHSAERVAGCPLQPSCRPFLNAPLLAPAEGQPSVRGARCHQPLRLHNLPGWQLLPGRGEHDNPRICGMRACASYMDATVLRQAPIHVKLCATATATVAPTAAERPGHLRHQLRDGQVHGRHALRD